MGPKLSDTCTVTSARMEYMQNRANEKKKKKQLMGKMFFGHTTQNFVSDSLKKERNLIKW